MSVEPASPCTGVCRLDAADTCVGCGRRLEESVEWPAAGERRKREIVAAARERLSQAKPTPA
jgi:predicted Fe-S protein YdhL (DUF1289 family)